VYANHLRGVKHKYQHPAQIKSFPLSLDFCHGILETSRGEYFILNIILYMFKRKFFVGSIAIIAALIGLPLYAVTSLTEDFGKHVDFMPLVRHMISQVHCYDTGTTECENHSHLGTHFTKEHTMGFLFDGSSRKMRDLGFEPLFLCKARDHSGLMMVTAGTTDSDPKDECRDAHFKPHLAGYISPTDGIEAPWPLYRCIHAVTHDTLLTDDAAECSSAGYGAAELLGYLYAGGPLTLP
jgi:hypothetical protein